jgi:hypothetical protein
VAAPDWLCALAPPTWHQHYDRRIEDMRLLDTGPKRDAYAVQVGADGYRLLDALDGAQAPAGVRELPAIAVLRRVWARHLERAETGQGVTPQEAPKSAAACNSAQRKAVVPEIVLNHPMTPRLGSGQIWHELDRLCNPPH